MFYAAFCIGISCNLFLFFCLSHFDKYLLIVLDVFTEMYQGICTMKSSLKTEQVQFSVEIF